MEEFDKSRVDVSVRVALGLGPGCSRSRLMQSFCSLEVGVVHAFCPHMGAHLGMGGVVVGNSLRCPFHGWSFNASGSTFVQSGKL